MASGTKRLTGPVEQDIIETRMVSSTRSKRLTRPVKQDQRGSHSRWNKIIEAHRASGTRS